MGIKVTQVAAKTRAVDEGLRQYHRMAVHACQSEAKSLRFYDSTREARLGRWAAGRVKNRAWIETGILGSSFR